MLPWLHDIYTIANSFFKMCTTEATRVGILKRKLQIDEATQFSTPHELVNLIEVLIKVAVKLLRLVLEFGRRFINDSYQVSLYLNMGRLMRAE